MSFERIDSETVWKGRILEPKHRDAALKIMRIQKYIDPMRRYLPYNPYAAEFGERDVLGLEEARAIRARLR